LSTFYLNSLLYFFPHSKTKEYLGRYSVFVQLHLERNVVLYRIFSVIATALSLKFGETQLEKLCEMMKLSSLPVPHTKYIRLLHTEVHKQFFPCVSFSTVPGKIFFILTTFSVKNFFSWRYCK